MSRESVRCLKKLKMGLSAIKQLLTLQLVAETFLEYFLIVKKIYLPGFTKLL